MMSREKCLPLQNNLRVFCVCDRPCSVCRSLGPARGRRRVCLGLALGERSGGGFFDDFNDTGSGRIVRTSLDAGRAYLILNQENTQEKPWVSRK